MFVNSFSSNNSSDHLQLPDCFSSFSNQLISIAFIIIRNIFVVSISILVIYLGYQQWRQQRSFKSASHSDIFTYHQAVMELFWTLGILFYMLGFNSNLEPLTMTGYIFSCIMYFGETFFHILTCMERYLAVVHPITYRGLQNDRGVTIRNICIFCSWSLSWLWCYILYRYYPQIPQIPFLSFLVVSLVVVAFCSLSVLRALVRLRPGEGGRNKRQTKHRPFFSVTAILGVLCLWFGGFIIMFSIREEKTLRKNVSCLVNTAVIWFSLPSSLVLPLLYVHKKLKLSCGH